VNYAKFHKALIKAKTTNTSADWQKVSDAAERLGLPKVQADAQERYNTAKKEGR